MDKSKKNVFSTDVVVIEHAGFFLCQHDNATSSISKALEHLATSFYDFRVSLPIRRDGLHLDEAVDGFSDSDLVAAAIKTVVAPTLRLSTEQQRAMLPHASIERYGSGELVQEDGVVPDAMSFIMSGTVLLTAEAPDGSRTEVGTLEEGSYLGHSTLIRHPTVGSSFALDEVTLIRVHRDAIEKVVQNNPQLLQEFGRAIDERRARVLRVVEPEADEDSAVGETVTP